MKKLEISKELLLELMPLKENTEWEGHYQTIKENSLSIGYLYSIYFKGNRIGEGSSYINIYEFAFKAKEWALYNGYQLRSWNGYCACIYLLNGYGINQQDYIAYTEIEAIIKACEWILQQKYNK